MKVEAAGNNVKIYYSRYTELYLNAKEANELYKALPNVIEEALNFRKDTLTEAIKVKTAEIDTYKKELEEISQLLYQL